MSDNKKPSNTMEVLPPPSDAYVAAAEAKSLEFMNPKRWTVMQHMAQTFISSGAVPDSIKNAAQMIMVFQKGYEIGLQPIESLESLYIVNGKITLWGDAVISQILKAGHSIEWDENCDDKFAAVTIKRGDTGQSMRGEFTYEKAQERGLLVTAKGNQNIFWKKSPDNMLKFKALGSIAKFIVPDALRGLSITEEVQADQVFTHADENVSSDSRVTPMKHRDDVEETEEQTASTHVSLAETLKSPDSIQKHTTPEVRAESVVELGLKWNKKDDAFVLENFRVSRSEILTLSDAEFNELIGNISTEMERRKQDIAADSSVEEQ